MSWRSPSSDQTTPRSLPLILMTFIISSEIIFAFSHDLVEIVIFYASGEGETSDLISHLNTSAHCVNL